jgi:hypothetical protein
MLINTFPSSPGHIAVEKTAFCVLLGPDSQSLGTRSVFPSHSQSPPHQTVLPQKTTRKSHSKHGSEENQHHANLHAAINNLLN